MEMLSQTKIYIIAAVATFLLLGLGVLILSKSDQSSKKAAVNPQEFLQRADSAKIATDSAKITLVEFGDYQCPSCGAFHPIVKQVLQDLKGQVNFVFRNYPLDIHKNARPGAYAVEAAGVQGKFWEMHDKVFENQAAWSQLDNPMTVFDDYAKQLGLDVAKFDMDAKSEAILSKIQTDISDGDALQVDATPTFFLNGKKMEIPNTIAEFEDQIKAAN